MRISDWSSDVCSSDLGSSCCLGDRSVGFLVDYLQRCRDAYPHGPLQEGPGACGRHELSDVRPTADDRRPGRYLRLQLRMGLASERMVAIVRCRFDEYVHLCL